MEINVNNPGQFGVIKDIPAHELPINAWSDGRNMRFANNVAYKVSGHQAVYDPPTVAPYWLMPAPAGANYYWLYAGLGKVYTVAGSTHSDITRAVGGDYGATAENVWTGGMLHGLGVVNNPVNDPQVWNPVSSSQRLVLLPNWPANTKCSALRPFKNFLVALDVTKIGTRYPQMVKWSDPADPGAVPVTWDPADATKRAGEWTLSETGDFVLDCLPLRDTNVIYKEGTTWGMQLVGGVSVFRFYRLFGEVGAISRNCAVEYRNGQHAVFAAEDIISHDGQNATSVLTDRLRAWVFARIDGSKYQRCFVAHNFSLREVWFCYPTSGGTFCNEAVVWNYEKNTTSIRELPNVSSMALGVVDANVGSTSWDTDTEMWSQDTTVWSALSFNPSLRGTLAASPSSTKLYQMNQTQQFAGVNMTAYLERIGLGIPHKDVDRPPDITSRKLARRIWPRIIGTPGGVVSVQLGGIAHPDASPVYAPAKNYVIGTTQYLDFLVNAPMLAVKMQSNTNITWRLDGYTIDVTVVGKF